MMTIDSTTALGMLRLGSRVSSASGAAPSQPVRTLDREDDPRAQTPTLFGTLDG